MQSAILPVWRSPVIDAMGPDTGVLFPCFIRARTPGAIISCDRMATCSG